VSFGRSSLQEIPRPSQKRNYHQRPGCDNLTAWSMIVTVRCDVTSCGLQEIHRHFPFTNTVFKRAHHLTLSLFRWYQQSVKCELDRETVLVSDSRPILTDDTAKILNLLSSLANKFKRKFYPKTDRTNNFFTKRCFSTH